MRREPFSDQELSRDAFLGGRATLCQPRDGYRAGIDPVLLAATVPARPGDTVLELGCGAGAALVCLGVRVGSLALTGIEVQPGYAALARVNLAENQLSGTVIEADITAPPPPIRAQSFHHVMANPPYFLPHDRSAAGDDGKELGLAGPAPLKLWVELAARRLRPGGTATFIQRADRLPELLAAAQERLGSLELWPLAPRIGRPPRLILLRGRKGGRAAFRFHAPLILHENATHLEDGEDYTDVIRATLRDGKPLFFPA
ncbi:tRNA1(Val) (adenine(37)-N6)-methyltransferase [Salipiger sp.]|uniref:tRNA1(Val) (adenine(37)-N6)-methyltransferase n=1 Tax=Salipiger sp. TaxID=2078585 RepID=UPI003A97A849